MNAEPFAGYAERIARLEAEIRQLRAESRTPGECCRRAAESMREAAARVIEPRNEKPCDCIQITESGFIQRCDCGKFGSCATADAWCCSMNDARAIRQLPLPPADGAGDTKGETP